MLNQPYLNNIFDLNKCDLDVRFFQCIKSNCKLRGKRFDKNKF